jgi:hypothetical protein
LRNFTASANTGVLLPPLELAEKRRSTERISRTSKKAELRDLRLELQQFSAKLVKLNRLAAATSKSGYSSYARGKTNHPSGAVKR